MERVAQKESGAEWVQAQARLFCCVHSPQGFTTTMKAVKRSCQDKRLKS